MRNNVLVIFLTFCFIFILSGFTQLNFSSAFQNDQVATDSAGLSSPSLSNSLASNKPVGEKLKKIDASGKFVEDEIVIRYKENVAESEKSAIASANETVIDKDLPYSKLKILKVDPQKREKTIDKLKNDPRIEYAGPNFATGVSNVTPNDPSYVSQWHLDKISAPIAWNRYRGSSSVKVAVVDTGINYYLQNGEFALVENGGRVIRGRDTHNKDDDPIDDNGHGTLVAGVLGAATNNGVDVAGVDWDSQIIAVKTQASNGNGGSGELAEGLKWLVDTNPQGLKVVNLSLWVYDDDPYVREYIATLIGRGIMVVVGSYNSSAGNYDCDAMPLAKYPGVIAVVGTDEADAHSTGCTNGISGSLMAAPSSNIVSEYALGGPLQIQGSGTSFAAPQVSGTASVLFSCPYNPSLNTVRNALVSGARDLGAPGFDAVYGSGRLNMFRAMQNVPECGLPRGDVDCNFSLNSTDALYILRYVAGLAAGTYGYCPVNVPYEIYLPQADVDGDGDADAVDALFVLQYVAGIRNLQTLSLVPPVTDTDGDGITNGQEAQYSCLNPNVADATANPDNDSVSVVNQSLGVNININMNNAAELALGTNPCVADTDGDGFKDGVEVYVGTKPEKACITSDDDIDMTKPTHPSKTWPADLDTRGMSYNKINLPDLASFVVSPKIYGTTWGDSAYDIRWDLVPGTGAVPGSFINISDLDKVATGTAPMFSGQKMYGGPVCTP